MVGSVQEQLVFQSVYFPEEVFLLNGEHIVIVMQLALDKLLLFTQFDILFFKFLDGVFLVSQFVSEIFNHGEVA